MSHNELTEEEFLAQYDLKKYAATGATVDLIVMTNRNNAFHVLLIERGGHPFKGKWALPGGFVEVTETLAQSAVRELKEETGLTVPEERIEQFRTYGNPERDPRGYMIATVFAFYHTSIPDPVASDDAKSAKFVPLLKALEMDLAFDHKKILQDFYTSAVIGV